VSGAAGFGAAGEELCRAALVRLDGGLRVLAAARAGLSDDGVPQVAEDLLS
jgi:hypothetical protein